MSAGGAVALWGEAAVARALAHPCPAPLTPALLAELQAHLTTDRTLAAWASSLPPETQAAVVRLVTGEHRRDQLGAYRAADRLEVH